MLLLNDNRLSEFLRAAGQAQRQEKRDDKAKRIKIWAKQHGVAQEQAPVSRQASPLRGHPVAVFQSMLGQLFDYGTVEIRGTGGSLASFATIAAPLPFRDAIQLVQSSSEKR